uniref:Uncharacterized protein n=1 Tax=Vespula pensylvanica TaxID=30213 RepID=A0A834UBC0_VESPE|nr:hypothetical protein H0235_007213 [Vespula pensylvanica]
MVQSRYQSKHHWSRGHSRWWSNSDMGGWLGWPVVAGIVGDTGIFYTRKFHGVSTFAWQLAGIHATRGTVQPEYWTVSMSLCVSAYDAELDARSHRNSERMAAPSNGDDTIAMYYYYYTTLLLLHYYYYYTTTTIAAAAVGAIAAATTTTYYYTLYTITYSGCNSNNQGNSSSSSGNSCSSVVVAAVVGGGVVIVVVLIVGILHLGRSKAQEIWVDTYVMVEYVDGRVAVYASSPSHERRSAVVPFQIFLGRAVLLAGGNQYLGLLQED